MEGEAELLVRATDGGGWAFILSIPLKYELQPLYPTFCWEAPAPCPEQLNPLSLPQFPRVGMDMILSTAEGGGAAEGILSPGPLSSELCVPRICSWPCRRRLPGRLSSLCWTRLWKKKGTFHSSLQQFPAPSASCCWERGRPLGMRDFVPAQGLGAGEVLLCPRLP